MASKMDPSVLQSMGAQVPGGNVPSADDLKRAQEQMAGMTPNQMKDQLDAAQRQMQGQEKYLRAIENIKSSESGDQDKALVESCNLNLALCQLKLEDFLDCIETCDRILSTANLDSKPAVKALFRRGAAQCQLPGDDNMREGYIYIKRAAALNPQDQAIEKEFLEQKRRAEEAGLDVEKLDKEAISANANGERPIPPPEGEHSASEKETPKIEELDDEEPKDTKESPKSPEVEKAVRSTPACPPGAPTSQPPASSSRAVPKVSPETVKELLTDKSALKTASNAMSGLSAEQLAKMTGHSKEQAEHMKDAMKQFQENPEMMNQVQNMMKNMSPEDLENMMKMQGMMGGNGTPGDRTSGGAGASTGGPPPDPAKMMKDPKMIKTAETFVKNMSPDMVKDAMKGQGVDMSDRHGEGRNE